MSPFHAVGIALRSLARRPGYALTAVLTLALGIGANTAIFSVLYGSLLRPLPYEEPYRLVGVRDLYPTTGGSGAMSIPNYLDLRGQTRLLTDLAAYSGTSFNLASEGAPQRAGGLQVTANFFRALGVAPARGRGFQEGDERPGGEPVAVVSHRLWREELGGRSDVLGQPLSLNARSHTVIGVLPEDFWFSGSPDVIVPFRWNEETVTQTRGSRQLEGFGRLAPGVEAEAAQAELQAIFARLEEEYPAANAGWTSQVFSLRESMLGFNRQAMWLLAGAVLLVLLVACVNVANLMLVRAERRQREFAVRAAIGAGRARLTGQFLTESLTLAGVATVMGLVVAWAGTRLLLGLYGAALPRAEQVAINLPVLGFCLATALLTGLLVGMAPAARLDVRRLYQTLREGGAGATLAGGRLQRALVVAQVALAVVLVAGAGLLMNSFWRLNQIDTGIRVENGLAFQVDLPGPVYETPEKRVAFFERAIEEIRALPAVQEVGITDRVPTQGGYNITTLASPDDPELEASFVEIRRVTPGFFPAAGIPLLRGRLLTEADSRDEAQVVVISDVLAETLFPGGDAVGRRIDPGWTPDGFEVVGVVGSVREFGLLNDRRPALYWPYPVPNATSTMVFVVRTASDPMSAVPAIRARVGSIDPDLPLFGVTTLEDAMLSRVRNHRVAATLFGAFGTMALVLSAIGIFSVLAYVVEQRTREIGIRVALGAGRDKVAGMVVGQGLRLVALGLALGLAGAALGSGLLADLLYDVSPTDPLTLGTVALVAVVTAAVATWLPARRAARVEPMVALRSE